jgi:hypothetical protein
VPHGSTPFCSVVEVVKVNARTTVAGVVGDVLVVVGKSVVPVGERRVQRCRGLCDDRAFFGPGS